MKFFDRVKFVLGMDIELPQIEVNEVPSTAVDSLEETRVPVFDDDSTIMKKMKILNDNKNYRAAAALGTLFTKVSQKRSGIIKQVDEIRSFYLVDTILQQISEDALAPDVATNEIFDIYSDEKNVDREIKDLDSRLALDTLVSDVVPDMLAYGDYILKVNIKDGEGISSLEDVVDQPNVIPVTTNTRILGYLDVKGEGGRTRVTMVEPYNYVKFSYGKTKLRIKVQNDLNKANKDDLKEIPRYIRIGKSLFYGCIGKLKELELLEQLVPATKLSKLASGSVIGVTVPPSYSPEKAMETCGAVEGILNKKIGIDVSVGQLTLENIMTTAGKIKVIPVFGEKGQLQKFDYKSEEPDELTQSATDTRRLICDSIGIPYELIFGNQTAETKGEFLKRYARYMRKLKNIQLAVADAIRQIVYIHLTNKGISFNPDKIHIKFKRTNIDIDNLDLLEFQDAAVSMLKNVCDFLKDLPGDAAPSGLALVNSDILAKYLDRQLTIIGLNQVIKGVVVEEEPPSDEEGDDTNKNKKPDRQGSKITSLK